jgi:hypothetical protein
MAAAYPRLQSNASLDPHEPAGGQEKKLETNEKGIHELPDGRIAWFKDPDGNGFVIQEGTP